MTGVVRHLGHEVAARKVGCPAFIPDARVGARASSPEAGGEALVPARASANAGHLIFRPRSFERRPATTSYVL